MPLSTWNIQFSGHNSQRRYPLVAEATALDETASFELPDDFLIGLDLPVSAGMDVSAARFFVRHIGAYATGYSIVVGYQPADGDAVNVASAFIPRQTHERNTMYALGGIEPFSDTVGKVVIGRLDNIDNQPPGFWTFALDGTRLEPDAVRPIINGVTSLVCLNGDQQSLRLQGDIELAAGQNMRITPQVNEGVTVVRFDAIDGEGTIEDCVCEGDAALTTPIRSINGVTPTPAGDIQLTGDDCIQVTQIANGLRLVDLCSKPCCGCEELEKITQDLERLGQQAAAIEAFVSSLRTSVDTMDQIVLGSRLNDRGCVTC